MKQLIRNNTVGFYATVDKKGCPCVSPKGTSVVVDDNTIIFGNIQSFHTVENIQSNPNMEVSFLDVLSRKAVRAQGKAYYIEQHIPEFKKLLPHFHQWKILINKIQGIVVLNITKIKLIYSPIYDIGVTEGALRTQWKQYYQNQ